MRSWEIQAGREFDVSWEQDMVDSEVWSATQADS